MSKCEAGESGNEELKKCYPLSPTVLWFVNNHEVKAQREKKIKLW